MIAAMTINRRLFLRSMLAAPAIVAASSLMPVKASLGVDGWGGDPTFFWAYDQATGLWTPAAVWDAVAPGPFFLNRDGTIIELQ